MGLIASNKTAFYFAINVSLGKYFEKLSAIWVATLPRTPLYNKFCRIQT